MQTTTETTELFCCIHFRAELATSNVSTESFRSRFHNCKAAHRSFFIRKTVEQVSFHLDLGDEGHHDISD